MHTSEWALVAFTLLAQLAVGAFLAMGAVRLQVRGAAGPEEADRMANPVLFAAVPILAVALSASLLHLGNPFAAPWSIWNLGRSWLSREILLASLFTGSIALLAFLQWRRLGAAALREAVGVGAAGLGIALVYSMSRIYMLRAVPAWNSLATPVSFFTTTLMLGALATATALVAHLARRSPAERTALRAIANQALGWLGVAALVLLGTELVLEPLRLAVLARAGGPGLLSARSVLEGAGGWFALRLALAVVGAGGFGLWPHRATLEPQRERLHRRLVPAAFALVLASESLGRVLFYAMYQKIGL